MIGSRNIIGSLANISFVGGLPASMTSNVTGSTTLTNNIDSLTYSGGSGAVATKTEYIQVTQTYWGNYLKFRLRFKPLTSGLGFALVLKDVDTTIATEIYFNISTGVITCTRNGVALTTITAIFDLDAGNYDLRFIYDVVADKVVFGLEADSILATKYSIYSSGSTGYLARTFQTRVVFYAGSAKLYNLSIKSAGSKNNAITGLGDSNMGALVGTANGYLYRLNKSRDIDVENYSWGGARCSQVLTNVTQVALHKSERYLINLGTNDLLQGVSQSTYIANMTSLINALISSGAKIDIMSIFPNNNATYSATVPTWNTALSALANGTTIFYIDAYSNLVGTGTSLNASYDNGDGIHINTAGNTVVYNQLRTYYANLGYQF